MNSYADDAWDVYWYSKNLQGDIVAIYNSTGTKLVSYTYTAWGTTTKDYSNNGANTTSVHNNLTYRGYYYDADLGMYYLQSRYYDPAICRFINADSLVAGVNNSTSGFNLYVYCFNNPLSYTDSSGNWPKWDKIYKAVKKVVEVVVEAINVVVNTTSEVVNNIQEDIETCGKDNVTAKEVIDSNYFSCYKGVPVVRCPGDIGFSFGIIVLGKGLSNPNIVKHEYGHRLQLNEMGVINYTAEVALPSVTAWLVDVITGGNLPFDYYTSPWEAGADRLGGVEGRKYEKRDWTTSDGYFRYLIDLFKSGG